MKSFVVIALSAIILSLAGCSTTRTATPSPEYPLTRPLSVVTEQPINPIIQSVQE